MIFRPIDVALNNLAERTGILMSKSEFSGNEFWGEAKGKDNTIDTLLRAEKDLRSRINRVHLGEFEHVGIVFLNGS